MRVSFAAAALAAAAGVANAQKQLEMNPFCNPCNKPDQMYTGNLSYLNFGTAPSLIPRATPDGVHPWPDKMQPGWPTDPKVACNQTLWPNPCFEYTTTERAGWWDGHASQPALPTNSWFTDLFSNSPLSVFPQVFSWPVFMVPYAINAANDGVSVTLPMYQVADKGGEPGIAGDIPQERDSAIAPEILAAGVDRILVMTCVGQPSFPHASRRIVSYDKNTLGVHLLYPHPTSAAKKIEWHVAKGHPYVTSVYTGLDPLFNFGTVVVQSINGKDCHGGCKGVTGAPVAGGVLKYDVAIFGGGVQWYTYLIYSSVELTLSVDIKGQVISAASNGPCSAGSCVVRVAVPKLTRFPKVKGFAVFSQRWTSLPPQGKVLVSEAALDASANTYPTVEDGTTDSIKYFYEPGKVSLQFNWATQCMKPGCAATDLLMLGLPHHQKLARAGAQTLIPSVQYAVPNGVAVGYTGNQWYIDYPMNEMSSVMSSAIQNHLGAAQGAAAGAGTQTDPFFTAKPVDAKYEADVRVSLKADMAYWTDVHNEDIVRSPAFLFKTADCYSFGKFVGAIARLVLIADELGELEVARVGRDFLRCRLNQWLDSRQAASEFFPFVGPDFPVAGALQGGVQVYDTTWGGLPTGNGIKNPGPVWIRNGTQPDFGSGGYNDHLFHYGYYLYAVSVVVKGATVAGGPAPGQAGLHFGEETCRDMSLSDADWFTPVSKRVFTWARDISNPNQAKDPYFAQFRYHSDWYEGHSWARGLFPSGLTSANIESTSEAMQAWYSMFLLGYAIQNAKIAELAYEADALMTTASVVMLTETVSVNYYWHLMPTNAPAGRDDIMPSLFQRLGVTGNLWGMAVNYQVFFSYGGCQWVENAKHRGPHDSCPYDLTLDQIHWFNRVFVLQIQLLPYTAVTESLAEPQWLKSVMNTTRFNYTSHNGRGTSYGYSPEVIWDDLPSAYTRCNGTTQNLGKRCAQGWLAYAYQALATLGSPYKEMAWSKALEMDGVADGSTVTNMLWWIATR